MPQKSKYDAADKERAVLDYLNGMKGCARIAQELGICSKTLKCWAALYKGGGIAALTPSNKDKYYPAVLKKQVVEEYLGGQVSIFELIAKYKISDNHVVTKWIAQYNNHVEFKSKQAGSEIYMAKGRPTTFEERQEIVDYCIAHEKGYRSAMEKYGVSYAQLSPSQKSRHEKALKSGMRRSFSWVFKSAREASCESCAQAARAARAAAKAAGDSQPRAECGLTVL